jgi:uncharacterized protein
MKELVKDNRILEIVTGSYLYGTNTPESDLDYVGIFIAPEQYYYGLSSVDEVDCSIISKREDGKNDINAIDRKFYELRKFMKLAMENNPNILEMLFTPTAVYTDLYGQAIIDNADLFPWKGSAEKFLGYAFSQRHKMVIKVDNYSSLTTFNDWLNEYTYDPRLYVLSEKFYKTNQLLAELREVKSLKGIVTFNEHNALIGDINISLTDELSKVHSKIKDRLAKVGHREELYTKYGYDTKFGMHLVRLMLEGRELLETGRISFPLKEKNFLLDIRQGKFTKEEIIKYSEELEKEVELLKETTKLPSRPRYKEIEELLISLVKNNHKEKR